MSSNSRETSLESATVADSVPPETAPKRLASPALPTLPNLPIATNYSYLPERVNTALFFLSCCQHETCANVIDSNRNSMPAQQHLVKPCAWAAAGILSDEMVLHLAVGRLPPRSPQENQAPNCSQIRTDRTETTELRSSRSNGRPVVLRTLHLRPSKWIKRTARSAGVMPLMRPA